MMKSERGFTLIELLVAISVISILLVIAVSQFNSYSRKNKIEATIKTLQADLLTMRAKALFEKSPRYLEMTPIGLVFYNTTGYSGTPTPLHNDAARKELVTVPLAFNPARITYEPSGMGYVGGYADGTMVICADPSGTEAAFDSLVVTMTFVRLGKRTSGGACTSANITLE